MKVIFLDFDGVLNSVRSATAFGGYPWNVHPDSLKLFDQVAISLIRNFCIKYDISIVLSSTWRKSFTCEDLGAALDLPIKDRTALHYSGNNRGEEIQKYLDANTHIIEYVIIDDDNDMLEEQKHRFIQTCPYEGFQWKDYVRLHELFRVKR